MSKIFICALGAGSYQKSIYFQGETFESSETRYVQVATMQLWNCKDWKPEEDDKIIALVTEKARKQCWDNHTVKCDENGVENRNGLCTKEVDGLKNEILSLGVNPSIVKDIAIPDGANTQEILEIFLKINEEIVNGAELYIDLTYGLRYLPVLVIVFNNYSRFINKTTCKHVAYGSYETPLNGRTPIIDLDWLDYLQQWTIAAENFIVSGNSEKLTKVANIQIDGKQQRRNKIIQSADYVTRTLKACVGQEIIKGEMFQKLSHNIETFDVELMDKPFLPIIKLMEESFKNFSSAPTWKNGLYAAKWCLERQLYQQALTLIQEISITHLCQSLNLDWESEEGRIIITRYIVRSICRTDVNTEIPEQYKNFVQSVENDKRLKAWSKIINDATEIRNQYNHAGMLKKFKKESKLVPNIERVINTACNIELENNDSPVESQLMKTCFINLSNHPSVKWGEEQLQAAQTLGIEVTDYPFPQVNPNDDENDIANIANNIVNDIVSKYSKNIVVHLMGEFTLCHSLLIRFQSLGIRCVAATTERIVNELPDGTKQSIFKFVRFRDYE